MRSTSVQSRIASAHPGRIAAALAVAALLLGALPAHAADDGSWNLRIFRGGVTGSGKLRTETRAVSGFRAVALRGSMKLVLRQGSREGIELRGDDNILPLIETRVVDHDGVPTLEIGSKPGTGYSSSRAIVATVDLTTLAALTISGSGDVSCETLKTPRLRIALSGSGNVRLPKLETDELAAKISGSGDLVFGGRAGRVALSISGSGDVDARGLEADDVSISVAGNGDATVIARKNLTVSIAGNGSVAYLGDPAIKSSIAGRGKVRKL
jgi:hypothetical protein